MTIQQIVDPAAIEAASMAMIDREAAAYERHPWKDVPADDPAWSVVRRIIHTTADFEMLDLVRLHPQAMDTGVALLRDGAPIITDTQMCRVGIPERRLQQYGNTVHCLMNDPEVIDLAKASGGTRARAAVEVAIRRFDGLAGCIMAVGNAPTALLALQDAMEPAPEGASTSPATPADAPPARPGLIIAMPVGFVNAAESKDLIMARASAPWIAIAGRKGGSALAAATVNALLELAHRTTG